MSAVAGSASGTGEPLAPATNRKKIGIIVVVVLVLVVVAIVVYFVTKKPAPASTAPAAASPSTTAASPSTTAGSPGKSSSTPTPVFHLDAGNPQSYPGTGSTWNDLAGSGIVTTLYNSPEYSSSNGGYLIFEPTKEQYGKTSASLSVLTKWTIEVWQSFKTNVSRQAQSIIAEIYGGDGVGINFVLGGSNKDFPGVVTDNISAAYYDGATWIRTPVKPMAAGWHHIVGSYDGTAINLYIDGVLVSTQPSTVVPTSSGLGYNIMDRWGGGAHEYWGGYLATLRIYNRALSLDEIKAVFALTKSRFQ
jgi:hypothetical protein